MTDPVLEAMADELRAALIAEGANPKGPPRGAPPAERAFEEYKRRGGQVYTNADTMAAALVRRVGHA